MSKTTITTPAGTQNITIEREFAATPAQVLRAHTDPELLARWLGPDRLTMTVELFEARDGGWYAYTHLDEDGTAYRFRGVFHGDPSVEHGLRQTFEYVDMPGAVALETLTFEDLGDGRTLLRGLSVYPSVEARDGMAESGMEAGIEDGYDKLDDVLASLSPRSGA